MRNNQPSKSTSNPRLPGNWTSDGLSKGKQTGPVRKSPDACNAPQKQQKS